MFKYRNTDTNTQALCNHFAPATARRQQVLTQTTRHSSHSNRNQTPDKTLGSTGPQMHSSVPHTAGMLPCAAAPQNAHPHMLAHTRLSWPRATEGCMLPCLQLPHPQLPTGLLEQEHQLPSCTPPLLLLPLRPCCCCSASAVPASLAPAPPCTCAAARCLLARLLLLLWRRLLLLLPAGSVTL